MNATPMTDGASESTRTTSRPLRTIRAATLAAVAIAVLMALPLPALGGPALAAATPRGSYHVPSATASTHGLELAPGSAALLAQLPASLQRLTSSALGPVTPNAYTAVQTLRASGALSGSQGALAPTPSVLSGNQYFGSPCSTSSTVAAVNQTNSTLLAGLSTLYLLFNASGGSFCNTASPSSTLTSAGWLEVERSTNSGQTWTSGWLPQNNSWKNTASVLNGSVPGMYLPLSSGPAPYASPSIAAANDGTILLGTQFSPICMALGTCTNSTFSDPGGIAVARSTDGGASWVNTTNIAQVPLFKYYTPTPTCQLTPSFYLVGEPFSPSVAINPATDTAIATWGVFGLHIDLSACLEFFSDTVQTSVSTNGGVSWSAPKNVTSNQSYYPQISVGPAPHYDFTIVSQNFLNATIDNTTGALAANWQTTITTNNGSTWSTPADIGTPGSVNLLWPGASSPNTFFVTTNPFIQPFTFTQPSFAIDTSPTSSHVGNEYIVWADNRTAGTTGQGVAQISFEEKTAGSSSWLTSLVLTPSSRSVAFLEPTVAVAPDGKVWVTFYGMSESSGDLNLYAIYSANGGSTWSALNPVSTQNGVLAVGLLSIGYSVGLAATSAGSYATWMDCRSASCTGAANESEMVSLVEPVALTSNISGVNMTVTTNGVSQTVTLPSAAPWAIGTTHTVSVPGWFPHNSTTVSSFVNYTGAVNSSSFVATFDYTGGSGVVANYQYVPGAFIAGTFSPNTTQSRLTIDGAVVPLVGVNATTEKFNYSVASGRTYYLNASASNLYTTITNHPVGVISGQTTVVNIVLGKTVGWITGRVTPVNATLIVNNLPVTINASNGVYNVTEPWGSYWVNATGYGVTNFSKLVTVSPGASTSQSITLIGGWIKGTLAAVYPGVTVSVDGVPVNTFLPAATFNQSYLGGVHEVVATAPGYNTSYANVTVHPARTALVTISLTNQGTIVGQVQPAAALGVAHLAVNNVSHPTLGGPEPINAVTGDFSVQILGETNYTLTVAAVGYKSASAVVFVRPGHMTAPVILTLVAITPKANCTANNTCPSNNSKAPASSGISPLLIGAILVVVVLVAAIAAVVLMRRRGGGSNASTSDESPSNVPEGAEGSDTYGSQPPPTPPPYQE